MDALRKKVEDDRRLAAAAHRRLVAENAELVREINEQRREAKALRDQLRAAAEGGSAGGAGGLSLMCMLREMLGESHTPPGPRLRRVLPAASCFNPAAACC